MKITNLEFNEHEAAALYALAGARLLEQGMPREKVLPYVESLTPQNVVRLALGPAFPVRKRGGARPGAGRRERKNRKKKAN